MSTQGHDRSEPLIEATIDILSTLVSFDTTSSRSNLDLIRYSCSLLGGSNVTVRQLVSHDGQKANLLATLGPSTGKGVVLSGHTDVVPVKDQAWTSDPFRLVERGGRLFGRGTADMKSFLAAALACVPRCAERGDLRRPIHFAFSYDEEVGCLGAPALIGELVSAKSDVAAVIVGEPTNMKIAGSHKGVLCFEVTVTGHEAHSSLTHLGVSANMAAIRLMHCLLAVSNDLEARAVRDAAFLPGHPTITVGTIKGGTAINILAGQCSFAFELRYLPNDDPDAILRPFFAELVRVNDEMAARFPKAGVKCVQNIRIPALAKEKEGDATLLVQSLIGDDALPQAVPFGSEAGQFQEAGFSTIICGPGSIAQAHQPDEYIERDQVAECVKFMLALTETMSR